MSGKMGRSKYFILYFITNILIKLQLFIYLNTIIKYIKNMIEFIALVIFKVRKLIAAYSVDNKITFDHLIFYKLGSNKISKMAT